MSITMKAALFIGPGNISVEEVPKAHLTEDTDAIIQVVRACVCGSDLWSYRGIDVKPTRDAIGHEAIGYVSEVGTNVSGVVPGDFVIVPFPYSCGICPVCKAGFEGSCPHGGCFGGGEGMGAQAEFLRVPFADGTLVKVPRGNYDNALLASLLTLSDVMATGYHAAVSAEVKAGDTAVIVGDGAVGLCGVIAARLRGASRIIALSGHSDRASLAKEFGATDIVATRADAGVAEVLSLTNGYGADAILECVGTSESFAMSFQMARAGAVIGRVGLPHNTECDATESFWRNIGVRGGLASVRTYDTEHLLADVIHGFIKPGRVFTAEFTIDQIAGAYEAMDKRQAIKSLIRF